MNKPRILIVISCYFPFIGGAENQAKLLAENLVKMGWEISVLTKKRSARLKEKEEINGVTVLRVIGVPGIFINLLKLRSKYDVVLFAGQLSNVSRLKVFGQMLMCAIVKLFVRKKIFLWPTSGASKYTYLFNTKITRKLLQVFDGVFCKSNEQMKLFSSLVGESVEIFGPPWSMIDTQLYMPPTLEEKILLRKEIGIPENAKVLLFTGRLIESKGIELLISAFERLSKSYSDAFLLIVGAVSDSDPLKNKYVQRINSSKFSEQTFKLVLNEDDVVKYFKSADIFVFPTFSEGCPVVQLEAMSAGLICVASDLEPITEKIEDGFNGFTFKTGDIKGLIQKLETAVQSVEDARIATRARESVVPKYSIIPVVERWESMLTEFWLRETYGVMILTPWAYPRIGGIQTMSFETAKRLTMQGFKVTLMSRKHDDKLPTREVIEGINFIRLSCKPIVMQFQLILFLIKEWSNFRHFSMWGAYGSFLTVPILLIALTVQLLGKKVSIRLSNQVMEDRIYANKVII